MRYQMAAWRIFVHRPISIGPNPARKYNLELSDLKLNQGPKIKLPVKYVHCTVVTRMLVR